MAQPINFDSLFSVNNKTILDVVNGLQLIDKTFEELNKQAIDRTKEIDKQLASLVERAKDLKTALQNISVKNISFDELTNQSKQINDLTEQIQVLTKENAKLNQSIEQLSKAQKENKTTAKEYENSLKGLKTQIKDLEKELEKTADTINGEVNPQYTENIKKLKELKQQYEDKSRILKESTKATKENTKANDFEANSLKDLEKQVKDLEKELSKTAKTINNEENPAYVEKLKNLKNLKQSLGELKREQKEQTKQNKAVAGSYNDLVFQTRELENRLKSLPNAFNRNNQEAKQLRTEIKKNKEQLRDFDFQLLNFQRNVGNYESALNGLKDVFKGFSEGLATGGALAFGALLFDKFLDFANVVIERFNVIKERLIETSKLTDLQGEALALFTADVDSISQQFGTDFTETLRSVNSAVKTFGITSREASNIIAVGFTLGGDASKELLSNLGEYDAFAKRLGITFAELTGVVVNAQKSGVLTDKATDTLKEFDLSIREQTKATVDALTKAFGRDFTTKLLKDVRTGQITSFEALKQVSRQINTTKLDTVQLQTVIADVFRGAGEDIVDFVKSLDKIPPIFTQSFTTTKQLEKALVTYKDVLSDVQEEQLKLFISTQKSSEELILFTNALFGTSKGFEIFKNEVIATLASLGTTVVNFFKDFGATLKVIFFDAPLALLKSLSVAFKSFVDNVNFAGFIQGKISIADLFSNIVNKSETDKIFNQFKQNVALNFNDLTKETLSGVASRERIEQIKSSLEILANEVSTLEDNLSKASTKKEKERLKALIEVRKKTIESLRKELGFDSTEQVGSGLKKQGRGLDFRTDSEVAKATQQAEKELKQREALAQKFAKKVAELVKDRNETAKRNAIAIIEQEKLILNQSIDFNNEIAKNDKLNNKTRIESLREVLKNKLALLQLDYDKEKKDKKLTNEEIKLLDLQLANDRLKIEKEINQQIKALRKDTKFGFSNEDVITQTNQRINKANKKANLESLKIQKDLVNANEKQTAELTKKQSQLSINTKRNEIEELESLNATLLNDRIANEDKILENAERIAQLELEIAQETANEKLRIQQNYANALGAVLSAIEKRQAKSFELDNKRLDSQIDRQNNLLQAEVQLATLTGEKVNLAEREQKIGDLENAKFELEQRKIRQEERLTFLKLLQGYLTTDKPTVAFGKALKDFALTKVVGSFYEGGFIGKGENPRNEYLAFLHGNEYVATNKQVKNPKLSPIINEFDKERINGSFNLQRALKGFSAKEIQGFLPFENSFNTFIKNDTPKQTESINYEKVAITISKAVRKELENIQFTTIDSNLATNIIERVTKGNTTHKKITFI